MKGKRYLNFDKELNENLKKIAEIAGLNKVLQLCKPKFFLQLRQ